MSNETTVEVARGRIAIVHVEHDGRVRHVSIAPAAVDQILGRTMTDAEIMLAYFVPAIAQLRYAHENVG